MESNTYDLKNELNTLTKKAKDNYESNKKIYKRNASFTKVRLPSIDNSRGRNVENQSKLTNFKNIQQTKIGKLEALDSKQKLKIYSVKKLPIFKTVEYNPIMKKGIMFKQEKPGLQISENIGSKIQKNNALFKMIGIGDISNKMNIQNSSDKLFTLK